MTEPSPVSNPASQPSQAFERGEAGQSDEPGQSDEVGQANDVEQRPLAAVETPIAVRLAQVLTAALGVVLAYYIFAEITGDPVWRLAGSGGFVTELNTFMATEWGVVSLIDVYAGFVIAMAVIIAFERKLWIGLAWAVPILFVGNVVTAIWFVLRFPALVRRLRG